MLLYLFYLIITLSSTSIYASAQHNRTLVTVFIHGTMLPVPSWSAIKHAFTEKKPASVSGYQHYLNATRFNSIVKYQTIGTLGLTHIENRGESNHTDFCYIAKEIFQNIYTKRLALPYENFLFYTFGWDGRLSNRHRKHAAHKLYQALIALEKQLTTDTNVSVHFDLYCHSHGGNVALNMGRLIQHKHKKIDFYKKDHVTQEISPIIKHLVLLGTPIQRENAQFYKSPLFETIYNCYSRGDAVQISDIISTNHKRSYRRFDHCKKNIPLTHNLKQLECSIGKLKPRHAELWLCNGEGNFLYRNYITINPGPLLLHIPYIMYHLDAYDKNNDTNTQIQNVITSRTSTNFYWHSAKVGKNFIYTLNPHHYAFKKMQLTLPTALFTKKEMRLSSSP